MNRSSSLLLAGACAAGLVTGIAGKRLFQTSASTVDGELSAGDVRGSVTGDVLEQSSPADKKPGGKAAAVERSSDTVESLIAIEDQTLYQRLALWLMDATEEEIAAYWQAYQKKDPSKRSRDINDLVFLNWTRLNPRGAIDRAGPGGEQYAWWAWACHDPRASLAAAVAAGGDILNHVTFGLGEFHPDWLREHIDELPEEGKRKALQGMLKWDDQQDPLATLQFMKENGIGATPGNVKALARHDPDQAIAWAREQGGRSTYAQEIIIGTLAAERPEDLGRFAAEAPSGSMKLKMEAALFKNLIKTDPAAALEQARATTIPRVAAERYAALGMDMVGRDPNKAFSFVENLFAVCPNPFGMMTTVSDPTGGQGTSIEIPSVSDFIGTLMAKDPGRLMDLVAAQGVGPRLPFGLFANQWADRDLDGYTEWLNHQSDNRVRESGTYFVSEKLAAKGYFTEAAEWAMSAPGDLNAIKLVMSRWKSVDGAAPWNWIEAADLPPNRKDALRDLLKSKP